MTKQNDAQAADPATLLAEARRVCLRKKEQLFKCRLDPNGELGLREVAAFGIAVREYSAAVQHLSSVEAQIGHANSAIQAIVPGGAVDFQEARAEVLARIARFRERDGS